MGTVLFICIAAVTALAFGVLFHWAYMPLHAMKATDHTSNATPWEC